MRRADELPPAESKERPEAPFSPDWGFVWELGKNLSPADRRLVVGERKYLMGRNYVGGSRLPDTDMQALMEAPPTEEPLASRESMLGLRDRIADAIDALSPRLQWIFEAWHYRRLSVRQIAAELNLSKSYVDRLLKQAIAELQVALADLVED